jgi:hypothetical protein
VYVKFFLCHVVIYLCTHCSYSVMLHPAEFFAAPRSSMLLWVGLVILFMMCFCCYLLFNSCITSNIELWVSMYVSFICSLSLLILHIWYFTSVFRCFPFFCFQNFHGVSHTPICMSHIQHMVWIPGTAVITSYFLYMLFIPGFKCSTCLPYVF